MYARLTPVDRCRSSKTDLLTLYFLDSGAYDGGILDWWGILHNADYDYLRQDQIDWFLQESGTRAARRLCSLQNTPLTG